MMKGTLNGTVKREMVYNIHFISGINSLAMMMG